VSVPAVSEHLTTLASHGVRVVVADLYGDLPDNAQGRDDLAAFQHQFAGDAAQSTAWTWGIASKTLSYRWDPLGEPDLYFLISADGRVRYVNSVPANTINDLIAQVSRA
jgi:hypothetical protein